MAEIVPFSEQRRKRFQEFADVFRKCKEKCLTVNRSFTRIDTSGDSMQKPTEITKISSYKKAGRALVDEFSLMERSSGTVWQDLLAVARRRVLMVLRLGTPLDMLSEQASAIWQACKDYALLRAGIGDAAERMDRLQRFMYEEREKRPGIQRRAG